MDAAAYGGACKALQGGVIAGHLVMFGSPDTHDLTRYRDFFTPHTAYELDACTYKSRTLYDHALDPALKGRRLAIGALRVDDVGVWIEAQLALRDEYEAALYQLAAMGKLNWSSGTAGHLAERKAIELRDGTVVHEILAWPLGLDASLTTRPADPRGLVSVKSLGLEPAIDTWLEHPAIKAAVDAIRRDAGAPLATYSFPGVVRHHSEAGRTPDARPNHSALDDSRHTERTARLRDAAWDRTPEWKGLSTGVLPVRSFTWLQRLLQALDVPVLVDFSGPDEARGGTIGERRGLLEDLSGAYGDRLAAVTVDMSRSAEVGAAYGVYDAATLLFRNGGMVERADGPFSLGMMVAAIERLLGVPLYVQSGTNPDVSGEDQRAAAKTAPSCLGTILPRNYPAVTWQDWALEPQSAGNEADREALMSEPKATDHGVSPAHNPEEPADLLPADWELLMRHGAIVKPAGAAESRDGEPLDGAAQGGMLYGFPYDEFFYYLRRLYWCARAQHYRGQRAPP